LRAGASGAGHGPVVRITVPVIGASQTGAVATRQTRWFEYLWAHLGERRLTPREWRALEGLVREAATRRFKNAEPTAFQMLLAACDVRESHGCVDLLVARVRGLTGGEGGERPSSGSTAPTAVLRSRGRDRVV
jgi:hypothetical protein